MVKEKEYTAIGLFNFAHSYAVSACELEKLRVNAAHWNAPVLFLYFHAIELYLKAFIVAKDSLSDTQLQQKYSHNFRKLINKATFHGLDLNEKEEEAVTMLADTDNWITARYIRIGRHQRLPFTVWDDFCRSLHIQTVLTVYEGSGETRTPDLWN